MPQEPTITSLTATERKLLQVKVNFLQQSLEMMRSRLQEQQTSISVMGDLLYSLNQVLATPPESGNGKAAPAATPPASPPSSPAPEKPASPLAQLREAVSRQNYVILDTETTGLRDGEICQISIIDHEGETLLNQLVKPTNPIPADATRIHGITNDRVKDAPGWSDVAPRVKKILAGKDVIVYNATYDRKMMHKSAEAAGLEKIDWKTISPWFCAMEAYAEFYGDWNAYHQSYRWQRLSNAAANCGVTVENAHDALGDCLMTLGVVKHIAAAN